jgi:hypothetical protein
MCRVRSGSCERTFHMRRRSLCAFGVLVFEKPNARLTGAHKAYPERAVYQRPS